MGNLEKGESDQLEILSTVLLWQQVFMKTTISANRVRKLPGVMIAHGNS